MGFSCSPLSVIFLVSLTILANSGAKKAGNFNNVVTLGKLAILGFIILVSSFYFKISNFEPFYNEQKGFMGVIEASTVLFFGYLGFDFITTISEEAINPIKDVPTAIIISVVCSMAIYAFVSFAVSGVGDLSASEGDGETALAEIF
jgi:amino acid transporter